MTNDLLVLLRQRRIAAFSRNVFISLTTSCNKTKSPKTEDCCKTATSLSCALWDSFFHSLTAFPSNAAMTAAFTVLCQWVLYGASSRCQSCLYPGSPRCTYIIYGQEEALVQGQTGTGQCFTVNVPVQVHPSWRQHGCLKVQVCTALNRSSDSRMAPVQDYRCMPASWTPPLHQP